MTWRHKEDRPTSWIGWLFEWIPGRSRYVVPALVYTLGLAGTGYVIALLGGFGQRYVTTPQIWALATLTTWVLAWGGWSTTKLRELPERIRPALRNPRDNRYEALAEDFRRRVMRTWPNIVIGLGVWALLMVWIWSDRWTKYFPESWDDSDVTSERVMLSICFVVGAILTVTMIWGFVHYARFTWRALSESLSFAPNLARTYLGPITSFGLKVGFGWSVAVTIAALFFARNLTVGIGAFLAVLALMGLTLIVMPQLFAHDALARMRNELIVAASTPLHAADPVDWVDRFVIGASPEDQERRKFVADLDDAPTWIYVPAEGFVFLAEFLVPVSALILTVVLAD